MKYSLRAATLALLASSAPVFAADNAALITPCASGCVTMRSKDVGTGVQSMIQILGDVSGNAIYGTAGTANANVLSVQGIASMTPLLATVTGNLTNISGTISLPTGASTSALQTTGNTALGTINTTLGSPFQVGGSIGNTTFGATVMSWGGSTLGAASNFGTTPGAVLVPGVNAFSFGATSNAGSAIATSANNTRGVTFGYLWNGTTWDQAPGDVTNGAKTAPGTLAGWGLGATAAAVPANAHYIGMAQGGNLTGLTGTSGNLNVQCANCSGSGVSTVDKATFTSSTSLFAGSGGFFQTTATNAPLTDGQQGMLQLTATRAAFANLRNAAGAEVGVAAVPLQVSLANTGSNATAVLTTGTGGTFPITAASGAFASGSHASGAFASGAFASGSVASGAMVDLGAIADAAATAGSTGTLSAKLRLMTTQLATLNTTLGTPFQAGGSIGNTTFAVTQATGTNLHMVCDSGCSGSGGTSSNFGSAFPTAGTAIGLTNGTNMVAWSASSNYGTAPSAIAVPAVNAFVTNTTALGQATMANSSPVVLASNQASIPVAATLTAETTKVIGTVRNLGNGGAIFDGATGAAPPANVVYAGVLNSGATGGLLSGLVACDQSALLNMTTATTTEIVALTSGRQIHVCSYAIEAGGTTAVKFVQGTGTNCGTGQSDKTANDEWTAQTGISRGTGIGRLFSTTAANALCVTNSAGVNAHISISYAVL